MVGNKIHRLNDVTVICSLSVVGQHGVLCYDVKLSGEDLSRYSNKIESVGI